MKDVTKIILTVLTVAAVAVLAIVLVKPQPRSVPAAGPTPDGSTPGIAETISQN